jgi:membrane protein YqaA with SNARE-associated domain
MLRSIVLLFGGLIVQELALESAALIQAHQGHYSWALVHSLFAIGTVVDIAVGYWVGTWGEKRLQGTRLGRFVGKQVKRLRKLTGTQGEKFAVLILGFVGFPFVNGIICSWLNIPFRRMFAYLCIGNVLQYVMLLLTLSGVERLTQNFYWILAGSVAVFATMMVLVERTQLEE